MQTPRKATVTVAMLLAVALGSYGTRHHFRSSVAKTAEAAPLAVTADPVDEPPSDRTPETYSGDFRYRTAGEMLAALGVIVYAEDKVYAFPDPVLGLGSQIRVYRAQPVLVRDANEDRLVRAWAPTVRALADEQRLDIGAQDRTDPGLDAPLPTDGRPFMLTVTRVAEADVTTYESIDFSTQTKDAPDLELGVQQVQQQGQKGQLKKIFHIRRENGMEVSRVLTEKTVVKPPQPKIVLMGTKIVSYGTGQASWYGGVPPLTAAHRTLPKGTKVRVVNKNNGKSVVVTINDRGPFVAGRIIDLSQDAFAQIAPLGAGVAPVEVQKYGE